MKIHQLSLFLENKPGAMSAPCRLLAQAGLNIITLSLADTEKFGILRLILRDWEKARQILEKGGCVVKVTEVVAIEVPDRPGGLLEILDGVEKAGVNVEYMYAFSLRQSHKALLVFRFDHPDAAIEALLQNGVTVLDSLAAFGRSEE
ncbi:MAG TPA: amino acid-binding protein [Candidatus Paceibacterota bacterium]|nr:amino acid-binding protein [Verrucomicrobiota bacterium]HOX03383.1 amino acid-binding protein [Verrucomicrobiota bacterium]HRZ46810.1 amino acid-binding protein [Candidatus Paceibacterota bacterium]HRZ91797.1 amino acid-binding protein [Candidatus Paceibacterota bacterium]